MKATTRIILLASAAATGPLLATPASAAGSDVDAADVAEIVVTALRREQSLQDVPAAISALSGAALEDRGVARVEELQFLAPSLASGKLLGQTAIAIRGVGLNPGAPGVAVAVHVDGVFQPQAAMGDLAQTDLARVEVLRGPQGTLYGRNANGGAVNFITAAPTDRLEGYVLGGYASYNESKLQTVVNLPLNDRLIDLIAPRPLLLIAGNRAVTAWMASEAYILAREPKELVWIEGASHVDLYDREPFVSEAIGKLADFFREALQSASGHTPESI